MARFKTAFFAFPDEPHELKQPILAAAELIKTNDNVRIVTWPQLQIFGSVIPEEVREGIEKTDALLCDITRPNLNVYYEIGYCIGLGKSLAPVLNVSFMNAAADIQKDGMFDIIGYKSYESSVGLAQIMSELPDRVLLDLYGKQLNSQQPIYFLSGYRKTDYINGIASAIKATKNHFRSFDPAETPRLSIISAIAEVTASAGVIVPFLEPYVDDAPRHNVRASLLAGLAHGLGREALLLRFIAPDAAPTAADYREDLKVVRDQPSINTVVKDFCTATNVAAQSIRTPRAAAQSASPLQRLTLGATAAENEFRTLETYFIETAEFLRTQRGEVEIVAGRKGSGKSAIFFMARDGFRKERRTIIADLKPESHQLSLFKTELSRILDAGAFDHTVAGFWYFVVLSELLLALKKEVDYQARRRSDRMGEALEIDEELRRFGISESGDFTARIHRLASYVLDEIKARAENREPLTPDKLTNIVYRGGVADAKKLVLKHANNAERLVFLFDNIDKGWATDGVDALDVKMVRLLLEALEKVKRDLAVERREFVFVVFLRNDVFELMVSETPDKGKAAVVRIDWTDRVKLKQVIQARLQASILDAPRNFNELWQRFFTPQANGIDSFDFFVDHCLMRPRFLISVIELAIANAVNRRHNRVEEEDCLDAVKQHSLSILNDFGYELRDVSGASEGVLYSLVGSTKHITKGEIIDRFRKANIIDAGETEKLFKYLLWYGVLGVVDRHNQRKFIYDFEYNMNRLQAEVDVQSDEPLFIFNPALHDALNA